MLVIIVLLRSEELSIGIVSIVREEVLAMRMEDLGVDDVLSGRSREGVMS
jgi:3-deoxy-D-manno-octulosonate 8-phosphate phosphatase KdsC-like HAD superfamily phosphatase